MERSRKRKPGSSRLLDVYQEAFRVRRTAFGDMHRFELYHNFTLFPQINVFLVFDSLRLIFIFIMCMSVLPARILCTTCVSGAHRGQKRTPGPLELEKKIVSHHVGAGK